MNNFSITKNSLDIPWIESPFFYQLLEKSNLTEEQKSNCKFYHENGYLIIDLNLTDEIKKGTLPEKEQEIIKFE